MAGEMRQVRTVCGSLRWREGSGGHRRARWRRGREAVVQSGLSITDAVQPAAGVWLTPQKRTACLG